MSKILETVSTPADLKLLNHEQCAQLADELREFILDKVSQTGGHLAANLGCVELTIALLRTFSPPADKLLFDTGHQTYVYKILTGRRDQFHTLRQCGGLAGFQRRDESEYDAFGAGHAGTALSAALGMAVARDRQGRSNHVVAILGDAAAGCGISLEALNNVDGTTKRLIVILNDNEMSIAANVGALSRYLGGLLANPRYNRWKRRVEGLAAGMRMGWVRSAYYRMEEAVKSLFLGSVIFEELGLRYVGPIDGHNIHALMDALAIARDSDRPILLHVSTIKGKGYSYAEELPAKWHGTPSFDVGSGESPPKSGPPTYSKVFGEALLKLATKDERIVAITAGMRTGTGLDAFHQRFPNRLFDVGISEEHAVVFAAGLAAEGMIPVFAVYSTFMQRAIDCAIHDICLQRLPVVICLDRAGVVGDDGPTHHGVFDMALLRPVPGMVIMQPKDEPELVGMLQAGIASGSPVVLRYPRGSGPGVPVPERVEDVPIGRAEVLSEGRDAYLWALGDMIPVAQEAAELLAERGIEAGVVNARYVRPLDEALLTEHAAATPVIATLENGVLKGGFGAGVEEALHDHALDAGVLKFGWPDEFIPHGSVAQLREQFGLTGAAIADGIARALEKLRAGGGGGC